MDKPLHLNREWLYQKYIIDGLSTYDIGKIVYRDPKQVHSKLRDFGIPTRPRGENLRGKDNYMQMGMSPPFTGKHHSTVTRAILSRKASVPKPHLRGSRNGMSGRTGTSNPNYKDGSSPERQRLYASGDGSELLQQVYVRDKYHCVRCGTPNTKPRSLHAHHIKTWASHPELRFDITNLVTLCRACHIWIHSRKNTTREYL